MAIPNLIGVLALSGTVIAITKNYTNRKIKKTAVNEEPLLSAFEDIQAEQLAKLREEEIEEGEIETGIPDSDEETGE